MSINDIPTMHNSYDGLAVYKDFGDPLVIAVEECDKDMYLELENQSAYVTCCWVTTTHTSTVSYNQKNNTYKQWRV